MLPRRLEPQLLTSSREAPDGDRWVHEVKYDGYRLLCRVEEGRARLFTRGGSDWTMRLRRVAAAVEALGLKQTWLDGELVALAADGRPDFDALPAAMRGARGALPLAFQVWDAPWLDGRDLTGRCVLERKAALAERVAGRCERGTVRYADHLEGRGPAFFQAVFEAGLEGIVSKRVGSAYRPGARTRDWVKVKCFRALRFRVAGYTPGLQTVFVCTGQDDAPPVYAGRVNGWARADVRRELRAALARRHRSGCPLARPVARREPVQWVEPEVEVEVSALRWRPGERLRHATLKRVVGGECG